METVMRITHIELAKEVPSVMGMMSRPELSIYHVYCHPKSLLENQGLGWQQLGEMQLEAHADKLAESYGDDLEAFKCIIPMTRGTLDKYRYEPGDCFILSVKPQKLEVDAS